MFLGITILILAFKLPYPPPFLGKPKSLNLRDCPDDDLGVILMPIFP